MTKRIRTHQDIQNVIREFRLAKNMSGEELGRLSKTSQSRISRLENGISQPSKSELQKLMNILEFPIAIQQQALSLLELTEEVPKVKYRPMAPMLNTIYEREFHTRHISCFNLQMLPSLLQSATYRSIVLHYRYGSNEVFIQRMNESMRRQDILWDDRRSFDFIIHEIALYAYFGKPSDRMAQLDRLERIASLPHISLGIIPISNTMPPLDLPNFSIFDSRLLLTSMGFKEFTSDDPRDLAEYRRIFHELNHSAYHNLKAKELLHKVMHETL